MKPVAYITTSWDDGHPLDYRVAELLAKYGLRGTFYVPKIAENRTMVAAQIRELSRAFESGAHTVHHTDLTCATKQQAWQEIVDSKAWLEDTTGVPCAMFCPPKGKYRSRHLELMHQAGYHGVRTAEPLSLSFPQLKAGVMVLPTTVHAHPHGRLAYAKYAIGWATIRNLWQYLAHGCPLEWPKLVRSLLSQALKRGGVFHLWGHSWELEKTGQWQRLEEVLRFLSQFTSQASALTNLQVCQGKGSGP